MVPVPVGPSVVSLPIRYGADMIEEVKIGELCSADVTDSAPTVTVMVLAEVTVTVAGPHSSAPVEAPTGELPVAEDCPEVPSEPVSTALDAGIGITVTVDGARGEDPVPVPVGPLAPVELPKPKGAVELPMGPKLPPECGTPDG